MTDETTSSSNGVIEILTLTLKPGTRQKFHQIYITEALPLLKKWNFQVVDHGASLHDENSYYIIRLFRSVGDRQREEDAYYGSDDWRQGPRSAIMALIEHEAYSVVEVDAIKGWLEIIAKQK